LREEVLAHYRTGAEQRRLKTWARLEFIRNLELLERYLPSPPARVADVGGGPGTYAIPLSEQGHRVHLLDPVALHVEQAHSAAANAAVSLASVDVGDARSLPWEDETMDAVVFFGPLYHLVSKTDRHAALSEARRVLVGGGLIFAMAISRFVSLHDGLMRHYLVDPKYRSIVHRDIEAGQHRNPDRDQRWFTTAYFHRPKDLEHELAEATFEVDALLAVEGPAGRISDLDWWLECTDRRDALLQAIRCVESEPSLLGASPQLLAVARKG
jgi:ubiquinone/menaquinone biosynthesis C-methylase UbiE